MLGPLGIDAPDLEAARDYYPFFHPAAPSALGFVLEAVCHHDR